MTILPSSGLDAALHASWEATAGLSLAAGVAAHHLVFRPFEVDGYAWQLLFAHVGAAAVLLVSLVQAGGHQLASALLRVLLVVSAYNAGAATSILVYRAFFHPLRRFPGPFSARLSRFYALGKLFESKKAYENVQRLHQEYGDIVRVGPRELSINRPSAITDIYGTHTQTTKSPWYMQTSKKAAKSSLFHTRAPEVHRLRKRVWERGLGFKGMKNMNDSPTIFSRAIQVCVLTRGDGEALDGYEQRVQAKVELLLSRIAGANGNPMNIAKYSAFFSFNVMADIGNLKN
ncbi:cytochrome p450 [Trichoderma cornu-damae]|uniref:Cytochrome p450 n=1 Tax=Trichoderma cornu-damae TaxID=654480 RepID=A0A9P8TSQ7_9HYPO|nr:cytochrome p450 [Trichoderma cornu-damae]